MKLGGQFDIGFLIICVWSPKQLKRTFWCLLVALDEMIDVTLARLHTVV